MEQQGSLRAAILAPEQPWNCRKADEIGPTVMKFMEDHEPFYQRWAETWFNNFQFIYGNQSIRWSRRYGYAVDVDFLQRQPAINQRAQTNISRVVAEALSSYIYGTIPDWIVDAASESSTKGKRWQKITQKLLDCYVQRLCMDQEFATAAKILTTFGQVAAQVDWAHNAGSIMEIPQYKKVMAPIFGDWMAPNPFTQGLLEAPSQVMDGQKPRFEERWEAVTDDAGRQIVDRALTGDAKVTILTPFEYRREIGSHGMHKTKYVQRIRLIDYDEFLDDYGDVGGQTKFFNKITPVYNNPAIYKIAVRHFMRMQFTTPPIMNDIYKRPENIYRNSLLKNKVLVVEHYDKPHPQKWPLGRRLIIANGDCTHVTVPSYHYNKLHGWHPFVEAQWLNIAPSSMSTGPMNDVVAKNRELNVADSFIATSLRRNVGGQLLIKTGSGLDPQRLTGEPGMVHEVSDPFGARWLHDDMPIPPVVTSLRDQYKDDVYESSGAMDALRGEKPSGVSSGYAIRQLQEREEKRLASAKKSFEGFVSGIGEKLFFCVKQNAKKLEDSVMGFLKRSASGEFTENDVVALMTAPIDVGVDIKVNEGSMTIKSKATKLATMQEIGQTQAVSQRLGQDAEVLDEYLKEFDMENLRDASSDHRERASRENYVFGDMLRLGPNMDGIQKPIVLFEDDDDIHIAKHTRFLLQNAEDAMKNELFLTQFLTHMETHRLQKQEKMGELMPGTSSQVPAMMQTAKQMTKPTVQTIYQKSILDQQAKEQNAQQQAAPQAPKQPAEPGSKGPPQTDPNAPAENTPTAASQGGAPK